MAEQEKPRTPAERIHERASDLARDALELQALTALNTDRELLQNLANWCDGHAGEWDSTFFEVQYGVAAKGQWTVALYLGRRWRHHRATPGTNVLETSHKELEKALVAMLKLVDNVAPAADTKEAQV